jgi:serine protease SohB
MNFWFEYFLFFSKLATFAIIAVVVIALIAAIVSKVKGRDKLGKLSIRHLNEHYKELTHDVNEVIQTKIWKKLNQKRLKKETKLKTKKREKADRPCLFVITFQGDVRASTVPALREEVTAILLTANPKTDKVLIKLESSGGMVHAYGLASSQLQRFKEAGIHFTVAVDKVAASGGYMMACIADEIIAAPFAVVGSIGVIAQLPNFNRYLDKKNVEFEQITAGKYKRTLTIFGKNTKEGREKMQSEVDDTHELFKEFINQHRPQVDLEQVATGEHWFAARAKNMQLVDKLETSDDFLLAAKDQFEIYELEYEFKKPLMQRFTGMILGLSDKLIYMNGHY